LKLPAFLNSSKVSTLIFKRLHSIFLLGYHRVERNLPCGLNSSENNLTELTKTSSMPAGYGTASIQRPLRSFRISLQRLTRKQSVGHSKAYIPGFLPSLDLQQFVLLWESFIYEGKDFEVISSSSCSL